MKRLAALALLCAATAEAQNGPVSTAVTLDTYDRAQSDTYFAALAGTGAFGQFVHLRTPMPLDRQLVVRPDRDTLHSEAVFDLDAGPATITMPLAGPRFLSMQVVDQEGHSPAVYYGGGSHRLTKADIGTRYVLVVIRILVDPGNPNDLAEARALQDEIASSQERVGRLEVPGWDPASLRKLRESLQAEGRNIDSRRMFGAKDDVDAARHRIGSAIAWGGKPAKDVFYALATPERNDGVTIHRMTVPPDVPAWEFWSISVYNADGFFEKNDRDACSLTNRTARKNEDGSITVQFGGCDGTIPNCLPIVRGWNWMARLYRPAPEVQDGTWRFPEAVPLP